MAMLAEPRKRKRYNLVPRGKALYEDDTRYGTKMLEKMGWSKGKGLGANEDGSQEFVRVRYKNDAEGLGYEARDDQWTQHHEDYNGLLKNLNGENVGSGDGATDNAAPNSDTEMPATVGFGYATPAVQQKRKEKLKEKISGESLEEKSKRSKARVHYKKFTRGKDLAQYSEKDLANIFGKKATEEGVQNEEHERNSIYKQMTTFGVVHMPKEAKEADTDEKQEAQSNLNGVQTISAGLSVSEYFKQKMAAKKNRLQNNGENLTSEQNQPLELTENEAMANGLEDDAHEQIVTRKKKKNKKSNKADEVGQPPQMEDEVEEAVTVKKKKKDKKLSKDEEEPILLAQSDNCEATKVKKKKWRSNSDEEMSILEAESRDNGVEKSSETSIDAQVSEKRKKKKSQRNEACVENESTLAIEAGSSEAKVTKKRKQVKGDGGFEEENNDSLADAPAGRTHVSASTTKANDSDASDEAEGAQLTADELISQYNSYNVYTISTFCAEKFRQTDIECFPGSNLLHIEGYGLNEDLKLEIKAIKGDEERITRLWTSTLNKYEHRVPRKSYHKYVKEVMKARRAHQQQPRFYVKSWKRKNAFKGI